MHIQELVFIMLHTLRGVICSYCISKPAAPKSSLLMESGSPHTFCSPWWSVDQRSWFSYFSGFPSIILRVESLKCSLEAFAIVFSLFTFYTKISSYYVIGKLPQRGLTWSRLFIENHFTFILNAVPIIIYCNNMN